MEQCNAIKNEKQIVLGKIMEKQYTVNTVPCLTWNWMKSNRDLVVINSQFSQSDGEYDFLPSGIEIAQELPKIEFKNSGIFNIPDKKYGDEIKLKQNTKILDEAKKSKEELLQLIENTVKNPQNFVITGKISEPFILNFNKNDNSISVQTFYAKKDSESSIILIYGNEIQNQIIQTKIYAEENAKIHLVKVQLLNENANQLDDTQIIANENAKISFTQIELGGKHINSGIHTTLSGYKSSFYSDVAYISQNEQYLDMNHIVYHYGKKSECNMQVNGTVKDNAFKTYKGIIDFKNGCSGSKGNELEQTLLLSPNLNNKSMPVILCDEEDVEGEHGATLGRLSSDILFYMQTRGIEPKTAEKIMSRAKIQAAMDKIPDEKTKDLITNWLDKNI